MPFPLAHPAAVLPLRRFCPQRLNFPALIIGSLCPDVGYCLGPLHAGKFSHRFLTGSFGFCLPVGLLLLQLFYLVRWPMVQWLSIRHRRILEPLCTQPGPGIFSASVSVLIGGWTHIFLDSITHREGWFVKHFAVLQRNVMAGTDSIPAYDLLYTLATFVGAAYVALACLNSIKRATGAAGWIFPGFQWIAALTFAVLTLLISFANHTVTSASGSFAVGTLVLVLVIGFFEMTVRSLRNASKSEEKHRSEHKLTACAQGCDK